MPDYVRAAECVAKAVRSAGRIAVGIAADGADAILELIGGPEPTDRAQALGPYTARECFAPVDPDGQWCHQHGAHARYCDERHKTPVVSACATETDTAAGTVQPAPAAGVDWLGTGERDSLWQLSGDADKPGGAEYGWHDGGWCWTSNGGKTWRPSRAQRGRILPAPSGERWLKTRSAPVEPSPSPGVPGAEPPITTEEWREALGHAKAHDRLLFDELSLRADLTRARARKFGPYHAPEVFGSDAPEFDWVTWVIPAITGALAAHRAVQNGSSVMCYTGPPIGWDTCGEFSDMQAWREHVAPIIAARIHLAAGQQ